MTFEDWWAEFSANDKIYNDAAGNFETAAACAWDYQQERISTLEQQVEALEKTIHNLMKRAELDHITWRQ